MEISLPFYKYIKCIFSPVPHWRMPLVYLSVLLSILIVIYHATAASIVSIWWRYDTFAHGFLILPFSFYMIWLQRKTLSHIRPSASSAGIMLLAVASFLWATGKLIDGQVIMQFALLGMIWAIILGVLGRQTVKEIMYPLAFMVFAIPFGEGLIPILMDSTANYTVKLLQLTGIPVFQDGMYFALPVGSFEVAKACSGIRYLFASVTLGCLFAFLNYRSPFKRTIFILVSIVLPIIANILRAYGIVLIANYIDLKYAAGVDHLIYGWLFFGFIMFVLFLVGNWWRDAEATVETQTLSIYAGTRKARFVILSMLLIISFLGPTLMFWVGNTRNKATQVNLQLPAVMGEWRLASDKPGAWLPNYSGATNLLKDKFTNGHEDVRLFIAYYANESQNRELINQDNSLYVVKNWVQLGRSSHVFTISENEKINYEQIILQSSTSRRIMWYWYDVNGYTTPSIYKAKLLQAGVRILREDKGGVVIAISTDFSDNQQEAIVRLKRFLSDSYQSIQQGIAAVRGK